MPDLSDFNSSGLDVECLAQITPGSSSGLYVSSLRGGTDAPTDGELGIGPNETVITRLQLASPTILLLNDDDVNARGLPALLSMSQYFADGSDGADLTIWFQTDTEIRSLPISGNVNSSGSSFLNIDLDSDMATLLGGLGIGDEYLFALTRPHTANPPLYPSADMVADTVALVRWREPLPFAGFEIQRYEVCVIHPDGQAEEYERTDGLETRFYVRGLAPRHRYGFRVRAVSSVSTGPPSETVYLDAIALYTDAPVTGQRIPLIDVDRQSLIGRFGGIECRISVWWQPLDSSWYASLEVPTNTPVLRGHRLVPGVGLLDRLDGILPGNLVLRPLGDERMLDPPDRNAWADSTHGLFWEADNL